ncbi:MAG: response regulator [Desulfobacterales bacterium]|nr:response regulator [Desulfobacterales bacterium]
MDKNQSMIYVIDDDASVRKAFGRLLRSANLDAETFSSAEEFLSSPKQKENACIIIDIRMPGLTGFDLQQRLLSEEMELPVIVISASDDVQTRERARELGAIAFFRKPIDDQALLDAIWWAIAGSRKN